MRRVVRVMKNWMFKLAGRRARPCLVDFGSVQYRAVADPLDGLSTIDGWVANEREDGCVLGFSK